MTTATYYYSSSSFSSFNNTIQNNVHIFEIDQLFKRQTVILRWKKWNILWPVKSISTTWHMCSRHMCVSDMERRRQRLNSSRITSLFFSFFLFFFFFFGKENCDYTYRKTMMTEKVCGSPVSRYLNHCISSKHASVEDRFLLVGFVLGVSNSRLNESQPRVPTLT